LDGSGGTRHFELARHLIRSGNRVTVITSKLNYLTAKRTTSRSVATDSDEPTILYADTLNSGHKGFVWRVIAFLGFMLTSTLTAFRVREVDLVMGTSPPIFQGFS